LIIINRDYWSWWKM